DEGHPFESVGPQDAALRRPRTVVRGGRCCRDHLLRRKDGRCQDMGARPLTQLLPPVPGAVAAYEDRAPVGVQVEYDRELPLPLRPAAAHDRSVARRRLARLRGQSWPTLLFVLVRLAGFQEANAAGRDEPAREVQALV